MKHKLLLALCVVLLATVAVVPLAFAQEVTEQDAIDLALTIPEVSALLEGRDESEWYMRAYNTENKYGVWRVNFYNAEDEDKGFADVNPETGQVFVYECYFEMTDALRLAGEDIVKEAVINAPEVQELLEDPASYDMYVDYDTYNDWWGVYVADDEDSLWITLRFEGNTVSSFDNPEILEIYFSEVESYDEWYSMKSQEVIAIAFANPEVGLATADQQGWTTETEHIGGSMWMVWFKLGDEVLAEVSVDVGFRTAEMTQ
jgi:hypothetical protein